MAAPLTIRLHPADNVVVARMDILPGTKVEGEVATATRVPPGHKILTRPVKQGERCASTTRSSVSPPRTWRPARTSTLTNCVMGDFERDYAFCADAGPPTTSRRPPRSWDIGAPTAGRRRATTSASSPR